MSGKNTIKIDKNENMRTYIDQERFRVNRIMITDCCLHSHAAPLPGHVSARAGPGPGDHAADPGRVLGHADKHVREARLGAARPEGGHTHQVPAAVLQSAL